ncbi:hypothetical protein ACSLOD_28160, partial [Escherichia coli]
MLGIENKYKQFRDLNKILIKPCVDELNKKSDLAVTASLWITWGAENKKPIKTMCCKKAELQVPNTPLPTLWKSSI